MTVRRLAWAGFGLWAVLSVGSIGLQIAVDSTFNAAIAAVLAVLAAVGLLLSLRRPENPIGPILLAMAILITFSTATEGFYRQWDGDPTPPLGVRLLVASDETFGLVWLTAVGVALPLLFPTGRPPSPRWRPLLWAALAVLVLSMLGTALGPERLDWGTHGGIDNPLGDRRGGGGVLRFVKGAGEFAVPCRDARRVRQPRRPPAPLLRDRAPAAEVDRARTGGGPRRAVRRRRGRPGPIGGGGQRRLVALHGCADRRHAGGHRAGDPAPPALRHRPRDPAHAGLRRADR